MISNNQGHNILDGYEFDNLLPKSDCVVQNITYGKGCEAHKELIRILKESYGETKYLSVEFAKETLEDTCLAIKSFLFNYIQYNKAGMYNVKGPACTWASRTEGTDCKSYSLFASSILINLGIKHYLRSVYYSGTGRHIYVIVPIDQVSGSLNETSYLNKNYYTVDGTFRYDFEPHFHFKYFDRYIDPETIENIEVRCDKNNKISLLGVALLSYVLLKNIR